MTGLHTKLLVGLLLSWCGSLSFISATPGDHAHGLLLQRSGPSPIVRMELLLERHLTGKPFPKFWYN